MPPETATQKLASHLLGRPVHGWIAEQRELGWTWRKIADDLRQQTGGAVDVSYEAIRLWSLETVG